MQLNKISFIGRKLNAYNRAQTLNTANRKNRYEKNLDQVTKGIYFFNEEKVKSYCLKEVKILVSWWFFLFKKYSKKERIKTLGLFYSELLCQAWMKPDKSDKAPHVLLVSKRFNEVCSSTDQWLSKKTKYSNVILVLCWIYL